MAFIHGKNTSVFFNDYNLSPYFNDASASYTADTAETSAFGTDAKTYVIGQNDGTLSLSGMYEASATGTDTAVEAAFASVSNQNEVTTSVIYSGSGTLTAGDRASMMFGHINSYDVSAVISDIVSTSMEVQGSKGVQNGVVLSNLTPVTATITSAAIDRGATAVNTAGACLAHVHIPTNTRDAGDLTVSITTSTTSGGTYTAVTGAGTSDFNTFAAGATAYQRLEITGAIERYVKVTFTVTGGATGSYVPIVTLTSR
jgi:hypothetical protein